ncbi:DUF2063 domain-containing protein [Caenimonas sedimenti]|uniref:DUF2063 domain-containing protein n=1 Tax=Caenimonas sedimenti TaxID=2596921 RepID=A0A562ZS46_9BURK|nr:putative DNA-binding domain-containing protein [Caenimonas sedimenti]TWO71166.1 DUF2063 domain-containing protein [Caenimonas sedimenti]
MSLAAQQQAMLAALWAPRPAQALLLLGDSALPLLTRERGLRAYRSNGRALAERALAAAHPVVAELLGQENFDALAHQLWLRHPPTSGDVGRWGAELPALIESLPDLAQEEPYLADVARLEWALHRAATAADAPVDAASFALLAAQAPERITLRLAPGMQCLASVHPVVSIVQAHLQGTPSLDEAGARLRADVAESALVWREGWAVRLRELAPGEAPFLAALQEQQPLAGALQAAPALRFDAWLAPAVQSGLVTGVTLINEERP